LYFGWLVTLDEVRFEQQRLRLGVGDGEVNVFGSSDHPPDAVASGVGVRPDATPEVDGLPDVEDGVVGEKLVDARLSG
jgi:hypothetical protein